MKRTEIERRERELKRARKKEAAVLKGGDDRSVADFINQLHDLFLFNESKILNTTTDEEILEILEEAQDAYPDKIVAIMKKAVRKTKVAEKDAAVTELSTLIE